MKKLSAFFIMFIAIIWFASGMATADTSHKDGEKSHAQPSGKMDHAAMTDKFEHQMVDKQVRAEFQIMSLASMNMKDPDGATHHGSFDVAYLGCLPGFVLMAAADESELVNMVATAATIDDRPSAFRYPRGEGVGVDMPERGQPLEIGKGRIMREGTTVALLSYGGRLQECLQAAEDLANHGLSATVADARFAKPLDTDLVRRLARDHEVLITVEEGSIGGFATQVMTDLAKSGLLDGGVKFRPMTLPDIFIDHEKPETQYEQAGLTASGIVATVLCVLGREEEATGVRA